MYKNSENEQFTQIAPVEGFLYICYDSTQKLLKNTTEKNANCKSNEN